MTNKKDKVQSKRFIEAAKAAGCVDDEAAFRAKLAKIASPDAKAAKTPAKQK